MSNFGRAIRLALRQRWTLVGIFVSSLVVALFWGANIGAVYPVIEIVFERKSLRDEVAKVVEKSETSLRHTNDRVAALEARLNAEQGLQAGRRIEWLMQAGRLQVQSFAVRSIRLVEPGVLRRLPQQPFEALLLIVIFLLVGTMIKCASLVWNMVLVARLSQMTVLELRNQFFRRTLQMELNAFNESSTGSLMSRFTNDVAAVAGGVATLAGKTLREPLKMLVCISGAAMISWRLLLLCMVVAPAALFAMYFLARSIKRANRRAMEEMALVYSQLSESFSGIKVVKAFTMERVERSRFLQTSKELYRKTIRITVYGSLTRANNEFLGVGVICLSLLAGGHLVLSGETHLFGIKMSEQAFSMGSMMLFYGFLIGISDPARKLADVFNQLQAASAAADRIYPLLDREPTINDPVAPKTLPDSPQDLIFNSVHFHYTPDKPILRGVDLRVPAGQTVAIVGPNGCGKSTLINLILRFYDPVEGSIQLGVADLRDLKLRDLRKRIGLVTQQTLLFDDTVANNIRYGSPHATHQQVIAASKQAHAHRFIMESLEIGYETIVGEGGRRLSGGQRQRLALARAFLRDPNILILDEATSQVDQESEQLIQKAIESFARTRTALFITHRMSNVAIADHIVVMDDGRVVDSGSHERLIEACPLYQRLYATELRKSA